MYGYVLNFEWIWYGNCIYDGNGWMIMFLWDSYGRVSMRAASWEKIGAFVASINFLGSWREIFIVF